MDRVTSSSSAAPAAEGGGPSSRAPPPLALRGGGGAPARPRATVLFCGAPRRVARRRRGRAGRAGRAGELRRGRDAGRGPGRGGAAEKQTRVAPGPSWDRGRAGGEAGAWEGSGPNPSFHAPFWVSGRGSPKSSKDVSQGS